MDIRQHLRTIADFPKPGILFYDIATLLADPQAWKGTLDLLEKRVAPYRPDMLAAVEARGFLLASPLAQRLNCGVVMIRKKGKLPGRVIAHSYDLEYGRDTLEVQADIAPASSRIVVVDDLLATGGTLGAAIDILGKIGTEALAAAVIIELSALGGRKTLSKPLEALLSIEE